MNVSYAALWAILRKDVLSLHRTRHGIAAEEYFIVGAVVLVLFAFPPVALNAEVRAGLVWMVLYFAAMMTVTRTYSVEQVFMRINCREFCVDQFASGMGFCREDRHGGAVVCSSVCERTPGSRDDESTGFMVLCFASVESGGRIVETGEESWYKLEYVRAWQCVAISSASARIEQGMIGRFSGTMLTLLCSVIRVGIIGVGTRAW